MTKLSIITICYNEPNLEKTCESIVNQTWQDFEWIVIDGGSNEETQKIWDKYKYRINKFISEPDNGIYNACNKGIRLANGEYLIFMNAGDLFYTNDVLLLVKNFFDASYDILYGEVELSYKNEKIKDIISHTAKILTPNYFISNYLHTQGVFIKTKLFEKFGHYDESLKVAADLDKWIQFIKHNLIFKYIPIIIASYDMNGISASDSTRKLTLKEIDSVRHKYYSASDIENADKMIAKEDEKDNIKYTLFEKIFSLKNSSTHKIITFLGIHLYIKR